MNVKIDEMRVPPKGNDENFPIYQEYIEVDEVEDQLKKKQKNGSGNSQ